MQRSRLILLVAVAVVAGLAAGYLALRYLQVPEGTTVTTATGTRPVVVATRDLAAGTVLGPEDVETAPFPEATTPASYPSSEDDVVGRGILTPISASEPILLSKLASAEEGGGLPIIIPPGMRAVSVAVDEVVGVAGFVMPGTWVDVIATYEERGTGNQNPASRVVIQNVRTLAAGQTTQRNAEGEPQEVSVITLQVDPEQAEILALAANEGRIQLALRNMLDREEIETRGVTLAGFAPAPAPARPAPRRTSAVRQPSGRTIETYEGTTRKQTEVRNE